MYIEFFLVKMKAQSDESGGRIMLGDNTDVWTVMLRPVTFQYFAVWTSTGFPVYLTIRLINSDLRKTRLRPQPPQCNHCLSRGVPCVDIVFPYF